MSTDSSLIWEQRIAALEAQVASMIRRLDMRDAVYKANAAADEDAHPHAHAAKPTTDAQGNIPRGKYAGRSHYSVVTEDPHHVVWNADKGYATGLGYTEEQVQQARHNAELVPNPVAQKSRRPW